MFDIGWSELLVVAIVAIVVVGPKELPRLMRSFGHYAGKLRRAASDFQRQFEEAVRESGVEEVRKNIENIHSSLDKKVMLPNTPESKGAGEQAAAEQPAPALAPAPEAKQPAPKRVPAKSKASGKIAQRRPKTQTKAEQSR